MLGYWNYTVYLTYGSALIAMAGLGLGMQGHLIPASICMILCGICDLFDGTIARTNKKRTQNEKTFGIQIDSLCDLISFILFPAFLGIAFYEWFSWQQVVFMLYAMCGLIRLSYFNVEEMNRQNETDEKRKFYRGIPVTFSAIFFPILVFCQNVFPNVITAEVFRTVYLIIAAILGILHISPVKLPKPGLRGILIVTGLAAIGIAAIILAAVFL